MQVISIISVQIHIRVQPVGDFYVDIIETCEQNKNRGEIMCLVRLILGVILGIFGLVVGIIGLVLGLVGGAVGLAIVAAILVLIVAPIALLVSVF
jgi:hypothetical protein